MKVGERKDMKDKNQSSILIGAGKAYSKIANETEEIFNQWMIAIGTTREDFIEILKDDDVELSITNFDNEVQVAFCIDDEIIGIPLIWKKEGAISYEDFKIDTALLFLFIASLSRSETLKRKIHQFLKTDLKCI